MLTLHRRVGILSALFVILLSVSGFLLNHSSRFALDQQYIASPGMLEWYGIAVIEPASSFATGNQSVTHIADRIYFNTTALPGSFASVVGFIAVEFGFAIATADAIVLLTPDGELIEVLSDLHGLPQGISQIGISQDERIYLRAQEGIFRANIDEPFFLLQDLPPASIAWSEPVAPTADLLNRVRQDYAGSLLTWERLLLDIHSGRVLGSWGVVLVDIMALLFVFMAMTGVWIWFRRRS